MNVLKVDDNWYSVENTNSDSEKNNEILKKCEDNIKTFENRVYFLENSNKELIGMVNKLEKSNKELIGMVNKLEKSNKELIENMTRIDSDFVSIKTENLKLLNRVLEAEISLERTRNSLLRKNIPFPFTPDIMSMNYFKKM
jgi:hypothetical protein